MFGDFNIILPEKNDITYYFLTNSCFISHNHLKLKSWVFLMNNTVAMEAGYIKSMSIHTVTDHLL